RARRTENGCSWPPTVSARRTLARTRWQRTSRACTRPGGMGKPFGRPGYCWAAGDTSKTVRDILQDKLFGPANKLGTGIIPQHTHAKERLDEVRRAWSHRHRADPARFRRRFDAQLEVVRRAPAVVSGHGYGRYLA